MSYWADSMVLWSGQALLLVLALTLAATLLRGRSASDRHQLWLIGLVVIAGLPIANIVIAALPVATPVVETFSYVIPHTEPWIEPPALKPVAADAINTTTLAAAPTDWRSHLTEALFMAWVGGVLISMVRPVRSYIHSQRLRAAASIATIPPLRLLAGHSEHVRMPMLAGIFRPMILLPADLATWAHPEEQEAIVLHEAAHFERRDHLVNLFQNCLRALLFFHPAVRYALRQLLVERELACDEQVLAAGVRPVAYAEALLKVAERSLTTRHSLEPAFYTSGKILERRMSMILSHQSATSGSRALRGFCGIAILVLAGLLLPDRAVTSGVRLAVPMVVSGAPVLSAPLPASPGPVATTQVNITPIPLVDVVRLTGRVYDQSGAVVPGVRVALVNPSTGASQNSLTRENGTYEFPQVTVGDYTLEARLPGFVTHSRQVRMNQPSVAEDVVLQISPVATNVEVSALAPAGAPAAPSVTGSRTPVRVGGDISAPQLISQAPPAFPAAAQSRGEQGAIRLVAVIGVDGTVISVQPDPTYPIYSLDLLQAAIEPVKQWRYRPATLNGMPIQTTTTITVNFTLR